LPPKKKYPSFSTLFLTGKTSTGRIFLPLSSFPLESRSSPIRDLRSRAKRILEVGGGGKIPLFLLIAPLLFPYSSKPSFPFPLYSLREVSTSASPHRKKNFSCPKKAYPLPFPPSSQYRRPPFPPPFFPLLPIVQRKFLCPVAPRFEIPPFFFFPCKKNLSLFFFPLRLVNQPFFSFLLPPIRATESHAGSCVK